MIKIVEEAFDKKDWNEVAGHPLQSWEWGEARAKTGVEVVRLGEFDNDTLKHGYQLTFHNLPSTPFKIGYLPRSTFPSKEVLEFLYDYGKKHNIIFIKLEPYEEVKNYELRTKSYELRMSSQPLFPKWTMQIDLTKSEDQLLKNMKPKTRYNIRLAQKRGVTVKEMTSAEGFEVFAKLYFETTKRQRYFGHSLEYHKTIFETLKGNIAYILVAFYENTPVAAYELFLFKDRLYYPYGGSAEEHRNVMGTNLLMWEAIRFGKANKAVTFDLWGAAAPGSPEKDIYAGFTRFKEGFGGAYFETEGSLDLVVNPIVYKLFIIANKTRSLLLELKSRFS